jgi:hypothetical protein
VSFDFEGKRVTLIDTPGFDDAYRTDVDILHCIASYLADVHGRGRLLDGLILLHPATLIRMTGSEKDRTELIQEILGVDAYKRVAIASTMWENLVDGPKRQAEEREEQRKREGGIWHAMIERGATVFRHENNPASAHNIIRHLADKFAGNPVALQIQTELVDNWGRVAKTSAGKEMDRQLAERMAYLEAKLRSMEGTGRPSRDRDRNRRDRDGDRRDRSRIADAREFELRQEISELKAGRARLRGLVVGFFIFFCPNCRCPLSARGMGGGYVY